jgi:hypothetical protein
MAHYSTGAINRTEFRTVQRTINAHTRLGFSSIFIYTHIFDIQLLINKFRNYYFHTVIVTNMTGMTVRIRNDLISNKGILLKCCAVSKVLKIWAFV